MNQCNAQPMPVLARPLFERLAAGVDDMLRAAHARWAARRNEAKDRREDAHAAEAVADLSPYVLRDIGAPEWLAAHAAERRESTARQMIDVNFR